MSASGLPLPGWRLHFERGRALQRLGEAWAAQREFEQALDDLARLRLNWLPAEAFWNASSSEQHRVYRDYIGNCVELYARSGRQRYLADAFAALAEAQAAGLRTLLDTPGEWMTRLPEEYWRVLAELRGLEMEGSGAGPARASKVEELQYRLTELELAAGLKPQAATALRSAGPEYLRGLQEKLDADSALIAFHLGERESYRWAVTRNGFEFRKLEGAESILATASKLSEAVRLDSPDAIEVGKAAYGKLFAGLSNAVVGKKRWVLGLESGLFLTPFAAMVCANRDAGPVYLAERHALEVTPTPALLERPKGHESGPFVAVADPVYNPADPRGMRPAAIAGSGWGGGVWPGWMLAGEKPPRGLARLAGSATEAENCARVWLESGRGLIRLRGTDATVANLRRALALDPSIVHIAAHFVSPEAAPERPVLALSLRPDGNPEWLSPVEISRWRYRIGTVVLSGCSSAVGAVSPAEGLMGMTRAWLAAGARSVIASLWPVPDDSGELFQAFYRHLAGGSRLRAASTAEALREAQMETAHSGGWRSRPAHWAAYILVGKE
jgi:CHAT domain-containing protein